MEVLPKKRVRISKDNPSLQRVESRCINCGMCMNICENVVGLNHKFEKGDIPLCINCGECIMNCPVGALLPKYNYKRVLNILKDTNKKVALSLAPAVRVALASEFGLDDGVNMESIIPTIARALGFNYVFDITFGADVTIMEEANELVERLKNKEKLPMFTSCCPSWIKYACMFYPELMDNLSTTKSPIGIQSTLIKTYYREMNKINDDIISVVVAPCTAKKYEIIDTDTDYIITTQEFAMMIRECKIDLDALASSSFDALLGSGSKSGLMFGRSGGVMESALNYVYYLLTGNCADDNYFHLDITDSITKASYKIGDKIINIAIVNGLKEIDSIIREKEKYDFIEVMNCPNGCVGGGGQPLIAIQKLNESRIKRLNALNDNDSRVKYCFQNSEIIDLYNSYLNKPLSDKALKLLHTKHKDLSYLIKK